MVAAGIRALAVIALLASACSSTPAHVTGKASSPRTASATPSPISTPSGPPCTQFNRCFALVTLRGSNRIVVRDLTEISHPMSLGTVPETWSIPRFASANEFSGIDYNVQTDPLVRMPFGGPPKTVLPDSRLPGYYDWSEDGRGLAYLANISASYPSAMAVHQLAAGKDQALGGLIPSLPYTECNTQFCAYAETVDVRLSYSPDGSTISLVGNALNVSFFRVWSSDGRVLAASDGQSRIMSVWSGNSLYFRDAGGVEVWRDATISPFLPGVAWIRPHASSVGGQIVYETRDAHHLARTFVVDTATRKIRELPKGRFDPWFLTPRYIWYQGQRLCVAADHCPPGWFGISSGKSYIYDLQTGTETESIITGVYDVWPHPA